MSEPIKIPELNTPIKFWTCPVCETPTIKWNGNKAWCEMCGRSNDDSVCQCGKPSLIMKNGNWVGCCEDCMPF